MSEQTVINGRVPATLRMQLIVLTLARLVLNTGHRMVYPFLPTFARGLGVDLETVALVVTARSGLGLVSPAFGSLADVRGRKVAMIVAMAAFAGGMALVMIWPTYPALFAGLMLAGVAKLVFDPAMQAYIGDRVPYAQRGQAMALTELSWSGAFLLGMPLIGWLIAHANAWQAGFPLLALLGALAVMGLLRVMPADSVRDSTRPSFMQGLRLVLRYGPARAGLAIAFLISMANEVLMIVYGAWMEEAFALKVTALGASAIVIGVAELGGEGAVAGFVDRLGKRRAVALGIVLNALAAPLLPLLGFQVEAALVALFLFFITFEFALVSSLPLMTELVPHARATLMAGVVAAFSSGRMAGALLGPILFTGGLEANIAAVVICDLLAVTVLLLFVRQD